MEALNPVLQPLTRVWRGLSRSQQIGLGAVLAAGFALLFIVTTAGRTADMGVAFSGLSDDDAATVVEKLKAAKIPYELSDQNSFGQTEYTQRVNYQRALENELARSIDRLEAVDSSRVHLVLPQPSL